MKHKYQRWNSIDTSEVTVLKVFILYSNQICFIYFCRLNITFWGGMLCTFLKLLVVLMKSVSYECNPEFKCQFERYEDLLIKLVTSQETDFTQMLQVLR
jgi:hypothetical protein